MYTGRIIPFGQIVPIIYKVVIEVQTALHTVLEVCPDYALTFNNKSSVKKCVPDHRDSTSFRRAFEHGIRYGPSMLSRGLVMDLPSPPVLETRRT